MPMPDAARYGLRALVGPVLVGLVYGLWALAVQRKDEAATAGEIWLSVVAGVVAAALFYALRHPARRLVPERRATAWGVSAGLAVGFLHSLVNTSVLWSGTIGFFVALGVVPLAYYRFSVVEEYPRKKAERAEKAERQARERAERAADREK